MSAILRPGRVLEKTLSEVHGTVQLVSFRLAQELYGIEITKVREIILITEITRIPQTPPHVRGLINLRNTVIPVIDLRILFAIPQGQHTEESRIMVLQSAGRTMGFMVDAVCEVLRIKKEQIASPPTTVAATEKEYLTGIVRLENQLLILLDIDAILADEAIG